MNDTYITQKEGKMMYSLIKVPSYRFVTESWVWSAILHAPHRRKALKGQNAPSMNPIKTTDYYFMYFLLANIRFCLYK